MMRKFGDTRSNFLQEHFVTCECGYNNRKGRLEHYGFCLRCNKVLDPKAYLKYLLRQKKPLNKDLD